jgi:hypothetical protein
MRSQLFKSLARAKRHTNNKLAHSGILQTPTLARHEARDAFFFCAMRHSLIVPTPLRSYCAGRTVSITRRAKIFAAARGLLQSHIAEMREIESISGNTGYRHQLDRVRRFLDCVEGPHASDVELQDMMRPSSRTAGS